MDLDDDIVIQADADSLSFQDPDSKFSIRLNIMDDYVSQRIIDSLIARLKIQRDQLQKQIDKFPPVSDGPSPLHVEAGG